MSYIIPAGQRLFQPNVAWPAVPSGGPWTYVGTRFLPYWFVAAEGEYDYAEVKFTTLSPFDQDWLEGYANELSSQFVNQGEGTLMAVRAFVREIVDVSVPDEFCIPSAIPYVGGCYDVPFVGGTHVVSMYKGCVQILYHNPLPLAVVIALAVIGLFGAAITVDWLSGGKWQLTETLKSFVMSLTPGGVLEEAGNIWFIGLIAIAAIGFISTDVAKTLPQPPVSAVTGQVGPIRVGVQGGGGRSR